jgi:hypothetical protein
MYRAVSFATALLAALTLASCAGGPAPLVPPPPPQPLVAVEVQPSEIVIAKPGTGEPLQVHNVNLTLRVKAPSDKGIDSPLPTTQVFDFYVMYSGVEVWRWSSDKQFFPQQTPFELPPGTGFSFTETWPVDAAQYVAGDYKVYGVVKATGDVASAPFTIRYPG